MIQKGYLDEKISRTVNLSSTYLATASFSTHVQFVDEIERQVGGIMNGRRMNGWQDGWLIFLPKKKKTCIHACIQQNDNEQNESGR